VRYLSAMKLWQRYQVCTKVAGWDNKWIYIAQKIESGNKICALGVVKGIL
jgi:hypothetical protein